MVEHSFNTYIAEKYGIYEAIFIKNMVLWTSTNAAKQSKNPDGSLKHFHEGRWWAYGTPKFFREYLFYFTPDQIRRLLERCLSKGLLIKSNFNQFGYDKTSWYALSDLALSELNLNITCLKPSPELIRQNCQMDKAKLPNGQGKSAEPIPDTKPDTKPSNTYGDSAESAEKENLEASPKKPTKTAQDYKKDQRFMRFYEAYPRKVKPRDAHNAFKAVVRDDDDLLEHILADISERLKNHAQWSEKRYIPYPATYLRSADYESEIINPEKEAQEKARKEADKRKKEAQEKRDKEQQAALEARRFREIQKKTGKKPVSLKEKLGWD